MKFTIWFSCFLVLAVVQAVIRDTGFILGGLPTAILYVLTFWAAKSLCKTWDRHIFRKNSSQIEAIKTRIPEIIWVRCDSYKYDYKGLKAYLSARAKEDVITKEQAKTLFQWYSYQWKNNIEVSSKLQ